MANGSDNGLSGIPVLGPILSLLADIFGSASSDVAALGQAVSDVEQAVWTDIMSLGNYAFGELGDLLGALGGLIGAIGGALAGIAKAIWSHLKQLLQDLLALLKWLHDLIAPLIKMLQQMQKAYNAAMSQYLHYILNIIQLIRKILLPFRLLHLAFATKLDNLITGFESDLGAKWAKLIKFDNQILGILNDVLDPKNLMRPGHVLGSLGMMVSAVQQAIGALNIRNLLCLPAATPTVPLAQPWVTTSNVLVANIQGNTGDYAVEQAQMYQYLAQYSQDTGVQLPTS
jgi:hypothetical protein